MKPPPFDYERPVKPMVRLLHSPVTAAAPYHQTPKPNPATGFSDPVDCPAADPRAGAVPVSARQERCRHC